MSITKSKATIMALIVAIAAFMQMLDASIIGTALPAMAASFGVAPPDVGVGIVVYMLAAVIVIPTTAWVADRFGARRVFVVSIVVFSLMSVICGLSQDLMAFTLARIGQGVAGAFMGPVGTLILLRSVDRGEVLRVLNISSAPMLLAPVIGPALGGFITESIGWPWIFFINVPIGLLGVLAGMRVLAPTPIERRPFDGASFFMNATALILLIGGLEIMSKGGSLMPGLAALAAGAVVGAFAVRRLQRHSHPLISLKPFDFLTFRIAVGAALPLVRIPIGALLFVLPILLQVGLGMSAVLAGVVLLFHALGDVLMKAFMTRTFRRFGYRTVLLAATVMTSVGIAAFALLTLETPLAVIIALAFVTGCVRSFVMTGLSTLAYAELPKDLSSSAVTLSSIAVQLAGAFAVSVAVLLFQASAWLRGGAFVEATPLDYRITLALLGLVGLLATPILLALPRNAGQELIREAAKAEA